MQETKLKEISVVQVAHKVEKQVEVAIAPAIEASSYAEATVDKEEEVAKEVEMVVAAVAQEPVDISDLDVPAFMRREASQKDNLDQ